MSALFSDNCSAMSNSFVREHNYFQLEFETDRIQIDPTHLQEIMSADGPMKLAIYHLEWPRLRVSELISFDDLFRDLIAILKEKHLLSLHLHISCNVEFQKFQVDILLLKEFLNCLAAQISCVDISLALPSIFEWIPHFKIPQKCKHLWLKAESALISQFNLDNPHCEIAMDLTNSFGYKQLYQSKIVELTITLNDQFSYDSDVDHLTDYLKNPNCWLKTLNLRFQVTLRRLSAIPYVLCHYQFVSSLSQNTSLQRLEISEASSLVRYNMSKLLQCLKNKSMISLNLDQSVYHITSTTDFEELLDFIHHQSYLYHLSFKWTKTCLLYFALDDFLKTLKQSNMTEVLIHECPAGIVSAIEKVTDVNRNCNNGNPFNNPNIDLKMALKKWSWLHPPPEPVKQDFVQMYPALFVYWAVRHLVPKEIAKEILKNNLYFFDKMDCLCILKQYKMD